MQLKKAAVAGTLESSDVQVSVEPGEGTLDISIQSSVLNQYGRQIMATVREVLDHLAVADAKVTDIKTTYSADSFGADGLVVKRGKKKFVKVLVK